MLSDNPMISGVDTSARKHEFTRHELVRFMPLAHQNPGNSPIAPDQNQGCCITRANCAGMWFVGYILHCTTLCAPGSMYKLLADSRLRVI